MHSTSGGSSPPKLAVQCSKALVVFWAAQCPSLLVLLINLWDFRTWTFHACLLSSARKFLISQALRSTQWSIIIHSDSFCCIASNLRGGKQKLGMQLHPLLQCRTATAFNFNWLPGQYPQLAVWTSHYVTEQRESCTVLFGVHRDATVPLDWEQIWHVHRHYLDCL